MLMSKYDVNWSVEKYNRFIKEGRGTGRGKDYKPWLTIQDFPSLGLSTRIMGYKTHRMHHFFTKLQLKYFYLLEWNQDIVDIREHFPLLDFREVVHQTSDLNNKLFTDKESGIPYVISTTFLITFKNQTGKLEMAARSIKGASELDRKSSLERLEMERRYWNAKGINWGIVTNKDISDVRVKNIEWLHSVMTDEFGNIQKHEIEKLANGLLERIVGSSKPIRKLISQYEKDYSLEKGTGIILYKNLIINGKIIVNMNEPIDLNMKSDKIDFAEQFVEEGVSDAVSS